MNPTPRSVVSPRPLRAAHPVRHSRPTRPRGRPLVLVWIAVLATWPVASAAEEPLALGNAQIGMTAEAMTATAPAPPVPTGAPEAVSMAPSEWSDRHDARDPWAPDSGATAVSPSVTSYDACVELAVRAGNGFRAASGVCAVIFPEPVAPSPQAGGATASGAPQGTGAPTDAAKPAGAAPPDDGPLVLTLDGPTPKLEEAGAAP